MADNYIPPREADFVTWLSNFNGLILADPTAYGFTSGDASALDAMTSTYLDAYSLALDPSTRTPTAVNAKDAARVNVTARARQLAQIAQANPAITDEQKTSLGITVRKTNRTPVPPPSTSPLLTFIAATPGQHTLRISDQLTPDTRAKPFGAVSCVLSVWYTVQGVSPTGLPKQVLQLTRQPVAIDFPFDSGLQGKVANYRGQWQTRTGQLGPVGMWLAATII